MALTWFCFLSYLLSNQGTVFRVCIFAVGLKDNLIKACMD